MSSCKKNSAESAKLKDLCRPRYIVALDVDDLLDRLDDVYDSLEEALKDGPDALGAGSGDTIYVAKVIISKPAKYELVSNVRLVSEDDTEEEENDENDAD